MKSVSSLFIIILQKHLLIIKDFQDIRNRINNWCSLYLNLNRLQILLN